MYVVPPTTPIDIVGSRDAIGSVVAIEARKQLIHKRTLDTMVNYGGTYPPLHATMAREHPHVTRIVSRFE